MPSRPRETAAEKIHRLEAELKFQKADIASLKKPAKRRGPKLIPHPEGQAGRGSGYNVQKEMRLGKNKVRFCRLSRIIRSYTLKYLDPHKTIKKQDSTRVERLITLLMTKFKYLARFQGGWPMHDLMKKVLQNSVRSVKADREAETLAEEEDSDFEEEDSPAVPSPKTKKSMKKSRANISSDSEETDDDDVDWSDNETDEDVSEDDEAEMATTETIQLAKFQTNKSRGTKRKSDEDNAEPPKKFQTEVSRGTKRKLDADGPEKSNKSRSTKEKLNWDKPESEPPKKIKGKKNAAPTPEQAPEPPKKKARISEAIPSPPANQCSKSKPAPQTIPKIPSQCPNPGCKDEVPKQRNGKISNKLDRFLTQRQTILATPGHQARQLEKINAEVCAQIAWENKQDTLRTLGRQRGWPVSLDLNTMVRQILALKSDLFDLVTDDYALYNNVVWTEFLETIDGEVHAFGNDPDQEKYEYAKLRARPLLSKTIERLVPDRPQDFDKPNPKIRPDVILPLESFIECVLMPHVAACLISQDMEVPYLDAVDIQDASADFGEMFQWDTKDPELVNLERLNYLAARDERPTPERESPRLKKVSKHLPPLSPSNFSLDFSPVFPSLTRAIFDSPAQSPSPSKKSKPTDTKSSKRSTQQIGLTLDDFPPRQSKPKSKSKTADQTIPLGIVQPIRIRVVSRILQQIDRVFKLKPTRIHDSTPKYVFFAFPANKDACALLIRLKCRKLVVILRDFLRTQKPKARDGYKRMSNPE
ncbi:hypothetical protein B0H11DRAFT_2185163 [Mycena galericulata]|nr:hypothetical protein B0H11DRAFT_2185163 [Mycena galericulata]